MRKKCQNFPILAFTYDMITCPLILMAVPEMDGRQMRLISYSGDQKLLQIR